MFDSGLLIGDGFSELRIWLVEGVGLRLNVALATVLVCKGGLRTTSLVKKNLYK